MLISVRRPWAWGAIGAGVAILLSATYLGLRPALFGGGPAAWEVLLLVFTSAVASACVVSWSSQRALRSVLQEVSDHVAALRQNPTAPPPRALSVELQPLHSELDSLVRYC